MKAKRHNKHYIRYALFLLFLASPFIWLSAQCPSTDPTIPYMCGPVIHNNCASYPKDGIVMENSTNIDYEFTNFSQYNGGITFSGATILHIKMDSASTPALCKWKLVMYIDNGGGATPVNDWETLTTYGSIHAGIKPTIDLLQVKVYNGCNTPICDQWQTFTPTNDAGIDIISSAVLTPAIAPCGTQNVNGVGSYLNHYNDYTFTVDYRIKPGVAYTPGMYQLTLHFCLVEDD